MKNKIKGFTIVELVIVIAVIAILAAVLIPTFSNVIDKANKSSALSNAKNAYTEFLVENNGNIPVGNYLIVTTTSNESYSFLIQNGSLNTTSYKSTIQSDDTLTADTNYFLIPNFNSKNQCKSIFSNDRTSIYEITRPLTDEEDALAKALAAQRDNEFDQTMVIEILKDDKYYQYTYENGTLGDPVKKSSSGKDLDTGYFEVTGTPAPTLVKVSGAKYNGFYIADLKSNTTIWMQSTDILECTGCTQKAN